MGFITTPIYIELIEVAHETMIGSRLRCILRVQVNPLLLYCLKLSQVVKIDATFSRIATKEENTVLKGETVGSRARSWLFICPRRV